MNTYISMLRGINVSGQKKIRMIALKSLYEAMSFANVQTYLQSGNVVFDTDVQDRSKLTAVIEKQIKLSFGHAVSVFLREGADLRRIIEHNPFLEKKNEDPAHLYVTFLYTKPNEATLRQLAAPENETGEFIVGEREIFLFCPDGYGRTKLSNNFFERQLNMPATTRNWRTVNALYDMVNKRT